VLLQFIVIMSDCDGVINKPNHPIQTSSYKGRLRLTIFEPFGAVGLLKASLLYKYLYPKCASLTETAVKSKKIGIISKKLTVYSKNNADLDILYSTVIFWYFCLKNIFYKNIPKEWNLE
jgi:hypothetical protein